MSFRRAADSMTLSGMCAGGLHEPKGFAGTGFVRRMIIVTGNLTINGSKDWEGIVLAGGSVTGNGNNGIAGAMVTGLNVKLGADPDSIGTNTIGNGTKRIYYNSCHIARALGGFGGLSIYPNAWSDSWPVY